MATTSDSVEAKWNELAPHKSPAIREAIVQIGSSLWYSTSHKSHFEKGEGGMAEYCLKTNKIISVVAYPPGIAPVRQCCCKYDAQIYIIDGENGMIILFDPNTHKFSVKLKIRKIGTYPSCVLLRDNIHLFHGDQNTKHLIYSVPNNTIQELPDPAAKEKKDVVQALSFADRIVRFGGYNNDADFLLDSFWMSSDIKAKPDKIHWQCRKEYTLPHPIHTAGTIVYKQYLIMFGGWIGGRSRFSDKVYLLDLNLETGWVELAHIKCPKRSKYVAILADDDNIHLFTGINQWPDWQDSVVKHYCLPMSAILRYAQRDNQDDGDDDAKCTDCADLRLQQHNLQTLLNDALQQNQEIRQQLKLYQAGNAKLAEESKSKEADLNKIQEECKDAKYQLNELQAKYDALKKQRVLDVANYEEWTQDDVLYWIVTLENGRFEAYETMLAKVFAEQEIDGLCLSQLQKEDIRGWGMQKFKDRSSLYEHVQQLINHNDHNSHVAVANPNEGAATAYI